MVPEKISGHLKGSHIRFAVRPHPRAVTAQELAAAVHVSGHRVAKSVLIEADGEPMMAVLPAADVIDVERLATALGVFAVRLMSEAEFTSLFNDSDTGAEPPFGSLYGVPVVVDKRLAKPGTMIVRAGSHQEAIEMRYQDFARLERPPGGGLRGARIVTVAVRGSGRGGHQPRQDQRRYAGVQGAGVSARPGTSCLPCELLDQLSATRALLLLS